jgi:predicted ATPase/class 3 adenylate cyclase
VTFLFTDLEGSTRLWEEHPREMRSALARHDEVLRGAVAAAGGLVVKATGDGLHAVFGSAEVAVAAGAAAQRALVAERWEETGPLRVRMGVHTGEAELRDGDYFGPALNRAARLMALGHGGQVLVSNVTAELVEHELRAGVQLLDLGEHRLRDLSRPERVFQLVAPGLGREFAPLRSLDVLPTNLPVQLTSFVGRAEEVKAVQGLLGEHRIVTLTGVGGVGKTRLALQVGAELLDRYPDGVWLVELAAVEAPRVLGVLAGVLDVDVRSGENVETALLEELRAQELVLVLDNAEHLLREVRRLVELILRDAAKVSLLVTSREGLRVRGEQLFSVPSLDEDAAVRLFVERARAVDPSFSVTEDDAETVAELCDRLDGMPLAIELAAARVSMFSIADLAKRVDQRFKVLTGGRGDVERHQTLRAAIDWSYDLLSRPEQLCFERLSVFGGGCTLEAAETIIPDEDLPADDVLELLASLIDKSLLTANRSRSMTRYEMSESVRQYAQERLVASGAADAVRNRHARWFGGFARDAGRGLYSPDEASWLARLRDEMDNLQIAVGWAVATNDTESAMRIGGSFPRQGAARPLLGTTSLAEQALEVEGARQHRLRARVLAEAAGAKAIRGDIETAKALLRESIEAQRAGARFAAAAYTYQLMNAWTGSGYAESYETAREGVQMAEAAGDTLGAVGLRIALSAQAMLIGRDDEAAELAHQSLTEAQRLHQPTFEAAAHYVSALCLTRSDPSRAIELLYETLDMTRRVDVDSERIATLGLLCALEAEHGDTRRSLAAMRETLVSTKSTRFFIHSNLYVGTEVFNRVGRPDLVAICAGHCHNIGITGPNLYAELHERPIRKARAALGEEDFNRHAAEGAAISPDDLNVMILREIDCILAELPSEEGLHTRP